MPKILIAEDEKALSRALELKLKNVGFEVGLASDGKSALVEIGKGGIDVVLLDLMMPGVDGFAVLSELKEKKIHLPVVVLSNLSQSEDRKKAISLGAVDYWVKADISLVEVVDKIKKLMNLSQ